MIQKVMVVKQWHHSETTQESQQWPKEPKQKRNCEVKNSIAGHAQTAALLQKMRDILRRHYRLGILQGTYQDVHLVQKRYRHGVTEKGEEEG
jgi:hypothetical protein